MPFAEVNHMSTEPGTPPFGNILAPFDGQPSSEIALRRSDRLLSMPGVRVTLLLVTGPRSSLALPENQARDRSGRLAAYLRDSGIEASVRIREGNPARETLHELLEGGYDLVTMTSRRRSLVRRSLPGKVALQVLRRSPVPLLLYRPLSGLDESFLAVDRSEPAAFQKILVMLDGSDTARKILAPALRLARAFDSEVILFHSMDRSTFTEDRMESAQGYLAELAEEVNRNGCASRIQITVGDPADEALRALEGSTDTIALTTRGLSSWRSPMFGFVASRLLRVAEGPVLCLSSTPSPALVPTAESSVHAGHLA
jgi:nucleotide-binding universal stress UspA family protein